MIDNNKGRDERWKTQSQPSILYRENNSEYDSAVAFLKEFHGRHVALHASTALFKIDEEEIEMSAAPSCSSSTATRPLHEFNKPQIKHCESFPSQSFGAKMTSDGPKVRSLSSLVAEETEDDLKENRNVTQKEQLGNRCYGTDDNDQSSWGYFIGDLGLNKIKTSRVQGGTAPPFSSIQHRRSRCFDIFGKMATQYAGPRLYS